MSKKFVTRGTHSSRKNSLRGHASRGPASKGIILLVVLGMLGLFSMLAVSYIVFTSRARTSAAQLAHRERRQFDPRKFLEQAEKQVIRGSKSPASSMLGNDLLGDYYGTRDSLAGQIRNASLLLPMPTGTPVQLSANERQFPAQIGQMFSYLNGQFVRVPTNLVDIGAWPAWTNTSPSVPSDDLANGRYLTLTDGPLANLTFEIVRSFGDYGGSAAVSGLTGAVMLDMTPHLMRVIDFDNQTQTLEKWISNGEVGALFYSKGGDNAWGIVNNDDDNSGANENRGEAGAPNSDDIGYPFIINGQRLNGFGMGFDPSTMNLTATEDVNTQPGAAPNGNVASHPVAIAFQPNYSAYRSSAAGLPNGDTDEPYDVPDYQNMFLAYFPVDAELGAASPSFVRPALINYLLNDFGASLASLSPNQLRSVLRALQRSTMRPLPIRGDPIAAGPPLAGTPEGVQQYRYDNFTGSNPLLSSPIDFANPTATQIEQLAYALAAGGWDVDNDGDGKVDSVWMDVGLPLVTMPDGKVVKPMAAYRIEDLGGRLDLNSVGSLAWWSNAADVNASGGLARAPLGPSGGNPLLTNMPNDVETSIQVPSFFGNGYSPADLTLRSMFFTNHATAVPSIPIGQYLLLKRYGKLSSDLAPGRALDPVTTAFIGANSGNDLLGILRDPMRPRIHLPQSVRQSPFDVWGRGKVVLDVYGQPILSQLSNNFTVFQGTVSASFDEADNDPGEMLLRSLKIPDAAFDLDEFEALVLRNAWGSAALPDSLKDLIQTEENNERAIVGTNQPAGFTDLASQITVRSSSDSGPSAIPYAAWRSGSLWTQDVASPHRFVPARVFQRNFNPPAMNTSLDKWIRYVSVVPPEIRLGRKFNLNRPIGNELDENGNGQVDESAEWNTPATHPLVNRNPPTPLPQLPNGVTPATTPTLVTNGTNFQMQRVGVDFTPEAGPMITNTAVGTPPPSPGVYPKLNLEGNEARQLYARHLFSMMMFSIKDGNTEFAMPSVASPATPGTSPDEITHWKLAQWAVNCVDFRDPDAVNTGFEFDRNPFDGWDVDGDLTTDESATGVPRGVVWGMESPALLLTESLAFHDRRVRDTPDDSTGQRRLSASNQWQDDDVDQFRIPQGSLFLELFAPRNPASYVVPPTVQDTRANPWGLPSDLYSQTGGVYALDLNKSAPDGNPVWRVGISKAHNIDNPDPNASQHSPLNLLQGIPAAPAPLDQSRRDTFTAQPEKLDLQVNIPFPAPGTFQFDRVIWLSNRDPDTVNSLPTDTIRDGIYYSRLNTSGFIRGGQYAVIAPRQQTAIGSHRGVLPITIPFADPSNPANQHASQQQIIFTQNTISVTDVNGNVKTPVIDDTNKTPPLNADATIREVVTIIAAAKPPTDWNPAGLGRGSPNEAQIGINISEPLPRPVLGANRYYPEPTQRLNSSFGAGMGQYPIDTWKDYDSNAGSLPDQPFDVQSYAPLADGNDFAGNAGQATGTRENYKTAYLQRLADPSQPYHPLQNPYLTVDWIPLDLTVFNGEDSNSQQADSTGNQQWIDPTDPDPFAAAPDEKFATRYKSGLMLSHSDPTQPSSGPTSNIFSIHTLPPVSTNQTAGATPGYFDINLRHDADINDTAGDPTRHSATLGYLNHSFGRRWTQIAGNNPSVALRPYVGAPDIAKFPTVIWNDRPYVSPYELMLVPFTSSGRFGLELAVSTDLANLYTAPLPLGLGKPYDGSTPMNYRSDFQHLLNFFSSNVDITKSPNFHRLLDWVETPETFDDSYSLNLAERFPIRPSGFPGASWPPTTPTDWNVDMPLELFRSPFNQFPSLTRRGKVNLNTINGNRVYRELMTGISTPTEVAAIPASVVGSRGAFYDDFLLSRRGYKLPNANPPLFGGPTVSATYPYRLDYRLDPDFPTEFAGAFMPNAVADLAPLIRPNASRTDWPPSVNANHLQRQPTEGGLLRQAPGDRGQYQASGAPVRNGTTIPHPLFVREDGTSLHQDRDRSPLHRYQGISRLANTTTGQSNVFSVWTTIGFFEIDVETMSVGQEYGYEDGTNKRHRSYMMIDRSVPVRYEVGEDHNTADTILMRRVLN